MAYSDFTARDLTQKFGIKFRAEYLFPDAGEIAPTAWLLEALERGKDLGFSSEKSRAAACLTACICY